MSIPIFLADNKSSSCQFVNRGTGTCWCLFVYILVVVAVFFSFHFFHCMVLWHIQCSLIKVTSTNIIVFSKICIFKFIYTMLN